MGNAFADALKIGKNNKLWGEIIRPFLSFSFPEKHRQNGDFLL